MKKKILAIIIVGLIGATVFGTISVSAASINRNQEVKPVISAGVEETVKRIVGRRSEYGWNHPASPSQELSQPRCRQC